MPKAATVQSSEKASKKPKLPSPLVAQRVKGSPRPQTKPKPILRGQIKGKEKAEALPSQFEGFNENLKRTEAKREETALPSTFKVIAGSYERLLYGLDCSLVVDGAKYSFHLKPIFIFPAHVSCIKAVAASPHGGKWLASGSADEIVKVWDLRRKKEIGGLMHHEGSITHLNFPSRSHLLSASEDGTLCLFRARDWAVLRSLKGHKGRVNSVAVHPSGKVGLSVGKDRTLRMWDLMRGKGSASTKLGKEGEIVRWSTDGSLFVVQSHSTIDLYSTDMTLLHTITHPSRLHDVRFCKRLDGEGEVILAAAEDKKVSIYDVSSDPGQSPSVVAELVGHSNRIKAIDVMHIALPETTGSLASTIVACTVSSDGKIHVYDLALLPAVPSTQKAEIHPVAQYDSKGTRFTCITLAEGDSTQSGLAGMKRGRDDADDDGGDDEDGDDAWSPEAAEQGISDGEGVQSE